MGHILGQITFGVALCAATVGLCWLILRHGHEIGRVGESRLVAFLVVAVTAMSFAAVLATWPTS